MQITLDFADTDKFIQEITNGSADIMAARCAAQAKLLCTVDKGQLRNSVMSRSRIKEGGFNDKPKEKAPADAKITPEPNDLEAYVGTNLFYAEYVEYGTRYMAPQPFLRPAKMLIMREKTKDEIKAMVNSERAMGKLKKGQKRVFD